MQKLKTKLIILVLVSVLFSFYAYAQEGSVPNEEVPLSDQPTGEQVFPPQEEILPATSEEPAGEVVTDPAPVPEILPETVEATSTPTPTPKPAPTPKPETQVIQLGEATVSVETNYTSKESNYIFAIIAGMVVLLGIGNFLKSKIGKSKTKNTEEKNEDDKKCLNFKKLMEEKLKKLTDLENQLNDLAKSEVETQAKKFIAGTKAEDLVKLIESVKGDYEKLKKLYEECLLTLEKTKKIFYIEGASVEIKKLIEEKLANKSFKFFDLESQEKFDFVTKESDKEIINIEKFKKFLDPLEGKILFFGPKEQKEAQKLCNKIIEVKSQAPESSLKELEDL